MSKRRRPRDLTKAAPRVGGAVTPAAVFTAEQVAALLGSQTLNAGPVTPLPRAPQALFGPGVPIFPAAIDPPRDDGSGRPEPRIYEYPVSINLPGMTDRLVPWKVLRDAAEIPVVRDCIRIRKNEVATLEWDIVVSKRALQQYRATSPDTSSVTIKRELRAKLDPEVARLVEFWQQPDFQQGETFVEWAGKALEEHLVLDALCVYPFTDRGRSRVGLRLLDGSTIKVLLDATGGRPMPPHACYQQILWGFPRGEFIADTTPTGEIINGYSADRLIYRRREVRTHSPYGMSAVEQALQDIDLYLRRLEWSKSQYTDGVAPAGWFKNSGLESWTPQQLIDYSRAFNDLYSGQTMERMRYHMLPPGIEPVTNDADVAEKYKPDYDLHLIKLVAMHFDVSIAELGFTEAKGLGSSGYHEGQERVQARTGTNPTLSWLQSVLTDISRAHLGMPPELEFRFQGLDADEAESVDAALERQLRSGRITWNEAREETGRTPYSFAEADMPMMMGSPTFLEGSSAPPEVPGADGGAPPGADGAAPPGAGGGAARGGDNGAGGSKPGKGAARGKGGGMSCEEARASGAAPLPSSDPRFSAGMDSDGDGTACEGSKDGEQNTRKAAELAAYGKWLRNGHGRRPFVFKHLTRDEATLRGVDLDRVTFTQPGGTP